MGTWGEINSGIVNGWNMIARYVAINSDFHVFAFFTFSYKLLIFLLVSFCAAYFFPSFWAKGGLYSLKKKHRFDNIRNAKMCKVYRPSLFTWQVRRLPLNAWTQCRLLSQLSCKQPTCLASMVTNDIQLRRSYRQHTATSSILSSLQIQVLSCWHYKKTESVTLMNM
jgi:hypothetical protein